MAMPFGMVARYDEVIWNQAPQELKIASTLTIAKKLVKNTAKLYLSSAFIYLNNDCSHKKKCYF